MKTCANENKMALGDNNKRRQNSSSQGKSTTKSRGKKVMSTSSPSHSSVPPLHPPSQGPSPFSHSFYGMPPQGYNSMLPQGYSPMPPPGYSSIPPQGYPGMPSTTLFYNMLSPGSSPMHPPLIPTHGMHSAYLAAMDRRPSPDTQLSEATEPASPRISRLNEGSSNSLASPKPSSTPSSVHVPDIPSPGKLDQLRRVRIIDDGQGFYPSRPAANAISAGIQKLYDGYYPTWSDVSCHVQQGVLNEFMKKCTWSLSEDNIIRSNFHKKASSLLSNMFSKARKEGKPDWLGADYWKPLTLYWRTPEFEKKSAQTKAARKSNKGGSLHTCGSVSMGTAKRKLEASLGRPATRGEVWKKTHMKIKDGKEVWVEARAEDTYNQYIQAMEELIKSKPTDDQDNQIMPSEEESLSCWLDVVGGVYKGRAYGLCSEKNFHRLKCGLQGIGASATMPNELLEEMQQELRELNRKYEEERKKRTEEERRRTTLEVDIKELKAQVNALIKLPRSPPPSSDDDDGEDEEDGEEI